MKVLKVSGKKLLAGIGILLFLGISSGCTEVQKFSWDRMKETHYRMIFGKEWNKTAKPAAGIKGQVPTGTPVDKQEKQDSTEAAAISQKQQDSVEKVNVALYFAEPGGDFLKAEKREIPFEAGLARATVEQLIAGPKEKGLMRTMPEGTDLLDINIQNGLCTVDFSKEFRDNHWGGSSGEILTVYSLVNTLTQFPTVEKVEVLVEGQKVDTLAGHMDLSVPVSRNPQIVK